MTAALMLEVDRRRLAPAPRTLVLRTHAQIAVLPVFTVTVAVLVDIDAALPVPLVVVRDANLERGDLVVRGLGALRVGINARRLCCWVAERRREGGGECCEVRFDLWRLSTASAPADCQQEIARTCFVDRRASCRERVS